jgi:hypothetical protein
MSLVEFVIVALVLNSAWCRLDDHLERRAVWPGLDLRAARLQGLA